MAEIPTYHLLNDEWMRHFLSHGRGYCIDFGGRLNYFLLSYRCTLTKIFCREENGGGPRVKDEDDSHVVLIQTVLDRAMKKDCLVNEVFLQLIKQVLNIDTRDLKGYGDGR